MPPYKVGANMRRREFIGTLIAATGWSFGTWAQSKRVRKIGALLGVPEDDPEARPRIAAFLSKLQEMGWKEGRDYNIDVRFGGSDAGLVRAYAKELVASSPEVILSQSNLALASLLQETRDIPIVFTVVGEPVGSGFIKSLARPGGNATGFTSFEPPLVQKWLQSLKEIAPRTERAGILLHPETIANGIYLQVAKATSATLGMATTVLGVHNASEIEGAIDEFARQPNGGIVVFPNPITNEHRELIIGLATRLSIPAVYAFRYFVAGGGLMSYGIDVVDLYKRAAIYVDRILKGEKPSELPVQQPDKFELIINLKTAKALGLTVPSNLVVAADQVIE
jgi:ABC-type uncharacterized transport system substrate-binding protein